MKPEIARALKPLVGLDLISISRSIGSEWFRFGHHQNAAGIEVKLAPFALQVSCPWRLVDHGSVLAGSADHCRPAEEDDLDEDIDLLSSESEWRPSSSQWKTTGADWIDLREQELRVQLERIRHAVSAVEVDASGWFRLILSADLTLEVFPNASRAEHDEVEFWRLFQPGLDASHFVVTSNRTERV